ncbi:MAG TPA: XdhC family protein [Gemmatimonadaceae bacterium]|nr:XdhC family protein [Gemmatimonadaceae bacterium]
MSNTFGLIDHSDAVFRDEPAVALATLISASGSSSKKIGAKMIVGQSARIIGGVTIGGCVDAQVIEAADAVVARGGQRLLAISLDDDEAWEIGLTCGGTLEVLSTRVEPSSQTDPTVVAHRRALELLEAGDDAVIVTPLDTPGSPYTVPATTFDEETAGAGAGAGRTFVDRIAPPITLLIVGAGQIAMSLTRLARELEMRSVVVDGRERYATRQRFPDADDIRIGMPSEIVAGCELNRRTAVVLLAHDYKYELPVLRHVLRQNVGYIGLLGSRKRGTAIRQMLSEEGFTSDELARIHTPIGLELGGKGSAEVALAVLAEIVAVNNGKRA